MDVRSTRRRLGLAAAVSFHTGRILLTCPRCHRFYADDVATCTLDGAELRSSGESTRTIDHPPLPQPVNAVDLPEGMMVGEYRIEKKLGEGGFGTVYRGVHPVIQKGVAIKVLNPRYASSRDVVSRFVAEARAVNQIRHRNIVDIFSFGTLEDGRHYFVMDLLEGMTLREYIRTHGRMDPREAVTILRPLARALDAAHAAGIAHRDLKPDNVFLVLEPDGHVFPKLIDFGLAKLLDHEDHTAEHRTRSGAPLGTPQYMSPEQCRGDQLDHRTDLYSFGIVVHELLTGARPFETGRMFDMFVQHTTMPPTPMSAVCSEIPPALDGPVLHMLAKKPEDRPATVGAAIDALARAIETSMPPSVHAAPGTDPEIGKRLRASKETRRTGVPQGESSAFGGAEIQPRAISSRRTVLFLGAVATLTAVVAFGASLRRSSSQRAEQVLARSAPSTEALPVAPRPAEPPPQSKDVAIEVRSNPPDVEIFLGDRKIGTSSAALRLPRSDVAVRLTAKASGYNTADIEVVPNENGFVSVTLSKPAPQQAPKKTARPTPSELENPFKEP